MRRARVNFEIVPDEEVVTNEVVSVSEVIERLENDLTSEEISLLGNIENAQQYDLETAANFTPENPGIMQAVINTIMNPNTTDELLIALSATVTEEEINELLDRFETTHPLLGGESFEVDLTEPYYNPTVFEVGAVRGSDLALPEELSDIFEPAEDSPLPVTIRRGRRRVHPTEEVPQQSINQELTPEELQMLEEAVIDAHREIPPNSRTLLISEATSRFSGAIWFEAIKTKTVMLAGLGGINSYTGFLLSRMQPANIILFDDDIVETVNLSGQLYSIQDVGNRKTTALAEMMRNYGSYHGTSAFGRYILTSDTSDIMICGFDNMESRKLYFNKWLNRVNSKSTIEEKKKCLYIDGRLSIEFLQIFCLTGDDEYFINEYKTKHFFSDSEANEVICSLKQTTFMANMIGSLIVNLFVNFVANECEPLIDRDVPFLTEYSAETMFLNTVH